jgi:lysophospholipase L1-like esterase
VPARRAVPASLGPVNGTTAGQPGRRAGRHARSSLTRIALLSVFAPLAAACVPPPPPPPPPDTYVALGDSFSAGTFIANQVPPPGCFKSDHSYPHLAAPSINLPKLVDVSCSGATTDHMTKPQHLLTGGSNPPQLDALDTMTAIVTITIGGNDVGYWSTIADACRSTTPVGTPCEDQFVVNGQDTISQRIAGAAPKVAAVLDGIHQRAPRAVVFILTYEAIFPESPLTPGGPEGCYPQLPYAPGDVPYLRAKQKEINTMLQQQAAAHGATFVDTYVASIGHDACRSPAVRWVEPTSVQGTGFGLHPNLAGMTGAKDALLSLL